VLVYLSLSPLARAICRPPPVLRPYDGHVPAGHRISQFWSGGRDRITICIKLKERCRIDCHVLRRTFYRMCFHNASILHLFIIPARIPRNTRKRPHFGGRHDGPRSHKTQLTPKKKQKVSWLPRSNPFNFSKLSNSNTQINNTVLKFFPKISKTKSSN
jgi:hypothetical protein